MNKTIKRRNLGHLTRMYDVDHRRHVGTARKQQRTEQLQRWWNKENPRDGDRFKWWSRQEKKQSLMSGTNAYDKWVARFWYKSIADPQMPMIAGRHVLTPVDVCWSQDRKLKMSLVKANAQGRRRKF